MNKQLLTIACSCMLSLSVNAQSFETATEAVKNMKVGWNLGNTLDSNSGDVNNMWIEAYTSRTPSDYEKAWGHHQRGATNYYVSSGLGIWGAKIRIGTRSEYLVLHINSI